MVQLGSHNSKSEMLIQSETAFNAGETENHSMDQLEALHQREHKDVQYFFGYHNKFKTKTSVSRKKSIAQILERGQSLRQYCQVS